MSAFWDQQSVTWDSNVIWDDTVNTITPTDIIRRALSTIGALSPCDTLDDCLMEDAFAMLNDMLDSWSNSSLVVVSTAETIATIAGQTDWTIGPGGQINAVRPLSINSAFVRINSAGTGLDFPVAVINVEQYELIGMKQLSGPWPRAVYYNSGSPIGTLKFWPKPSQGEIHLFTNQLFTRFQSLVEVLQFPPGYVMAMVWNLAELLMPGYGKQGQIAVSMVQNNARKFLGVLKSTNAQPQQTMQFDPGMGGMRGSGNGPVGGAWIFSGGFN